MSWSIWLISLAPKISSPNRRPAVTHGCDEYSNEQGDLNLVLYNPKSAFSSSLSTSIRTTCHMQTLDVWADHRQFFLGLTDVIPGFALISAPAIFAA